MENAERAYYTALFRRDFREAQRLYREVVCTDAWTPDRVVREAHKCGLYDDADRDDEPQLAAVTAISTLLPRETRIAA
jgi:hypothetical protein